MNSKGNIFDAMYVIPLVVMIVFVLIFMGAKVFNSMNTAYDSVPGLDATTRATAQAANSGVIDSLNYWPVIVIGVGIIGMLFLATYLNTSPAMMFLVFIIFLFLAGSMFIYSNSIEMGFDNDQFTTEKAQMPEATNIIPQLPLIFIGGGALLLVVMYARIRGGGGGV